MQILELNHIAGWVLFAMGTMYAILISILGSSLWDLLRGKNGDPERQDIFFDKYNDVIEFSIAAGPLVGLLETNSLGSQALSKAAPVLSGTANGSAQMGEMFNAIAGAMSATSLGIGLALTGFVVGLVCRWIYQVEPEKETRPAVETVATRVGSQTAPATSKPKMDYKEIIRREAALIFKRGDRPGDAGKKDFLDLKKGDAVRPQTTTLHEVA